jgi:hypothetical protein
VEPAQEEQQKTLNPSGVSQAPASAHARQGSALKQHSTSLLTDMPIRRTYKVFISHAWDYGDDYWRVVQFLDNAPDFRWQNLSIPEHDPVDDNDLAYELRNEMRPADVFLVIAGMYAAQREWIEFELGFARRIGTPVIGIMKRGAQRLPVVIQRAAVEIVGWSGASIIQAIRRHALKMGK